MMKAEIGASLAVLAILALTLLGEPGFASSTAQPGEREVCLSLSLSCPKERVSLDGEMSFRVLLRNHCNTEVLVFGDLRWGPSAGLTLELRDEKGHRVYPERFEHDRLTPGQVAKEENWVRLNKDHFLGLTRSDWVADLLPESGTYSMSVSYLSPVPEAMIEDPRFWSRRRGRLTSNTCTLVVEDP